MYNAKSICILLTEDHDDSRKVTARLLRLDGYVVHEAKTVSEARAVAAKIGCNLLISDLGLTDASGESLMEELHALYGLKGIAVSGYATDERIDEATRAGFSRFIAKPFHLPVLLAAIREVMA